MKPGRQRYRLLLVEPFLALTFVLAYAFLAAVVPLTCWWTGVTREQLGIHAAKFESMSGVVVLIGAAVYGLSRAASFHPLWENGYRAWLQSTPWTADAPLPLQPVKLVWQDALVLGVFSLLALRHPDMHPALPLEVFGFTYLLLTALALGAPAARWARTALLASLPVVLLPQVSVAWGAAVCVALYPLALAGTRRALAGIPWKPEDADTARARGLVVARTARKSVGWPFRQLSPVEPDDAIGVGMALRIAALLAWWTYAGFMARFKTDLPAEPETSKVVAIGLVFAGLRVMRYLFGHAPPIGAMARIRTGRLIIPGYDKIFVAPAMIVLAGLQLPQLLALTPLGLIASASIVLGVMIFLALALGPTLSDWHLTGDHRLWHAGQAEEPTSSRDDANATTA